MPSDFSKKLAEREAPSWTKKKVWPHVATAVALPAYAAYRIGKETLDVAKKIPMAMKESSQLMTNAPGYIQKHGETALATAGAVTGGRFLAKPQASEVGLGLRSVIKGLRKDAAELERSVRDNCGWQKYDVPLIKETMDTVRFFQNKRVSPKVYKGINSIGMSKYKPYYDGAYYLARPNEVKNASKYVSGRRVKTSGIEFAGYDQTTIFHELEHYLDDVRVFPSTPNELMQNIEDRLRRSIGDKETYKYSPFEEMADSVSVILSKMKGKITKKKWLDIREVVLDDMLKGKESRGKWREKLLLPTVCF